MYVCLYVCLYICLYVCLYLCYATTPKTLCIFGIKLQIHPDITLSTNNCPLLLLHTIVRNTLLTTSYVFSLIVQSDVIYKGKASLHVTVAANIRPSSQILEAINILTGCTMCKGIDGYSCVSRHCAVVYELSGVLLVRIVFHKAKIHGGTYLVA